MTKEQEQQIIELFNRGLSDYEISEIVHFSEGYIAQTRRRNNAYKSVKRNDYEKVDKLLLEGKYTQTEIAKMCDCSAGAVSRRSLKIGAVNVNKNQKSYDELFRLHSLGFNDREISQKIGLSKTTVYQIRKKYGLKSNFDFKAKRRFVPHIKSRRNKKKWGNING